MNEEEEWFAKLCDIIVAEGLAVAMANEFQCTVSTGGRAARYAPADLERCDRR